MRVIFFGNGNTACLNESGQQIPNLQKSYMQLYCEFLEKNKIDPLEVDFTMANGARAKAFKTVSGDWNWKFI